MEASATLSSQFLLPPVLNVSPFPSLPPPELFVKLFVQVRFFLRQAKDRIDAAARALPPAAKRATLSVARELDVHLSLQRAALRTPRQVRVGPHEELKIRDKADKLVGGVEAPK